MSRNFEASGAFYNARNHGGPIERHALMKTLEERSLTEGTPEGIAWARRYAHNTIAQQGGSQSQQ